MGAEGFEASGHFRDVITNPANGASVTVSAAGQIQGSPLPDGPDGLRRYLVTFKRLPEKIRPPAAAC